MDEVEKFLKVSTSTALLSYGILLCNMDRIKKEDSPDVLALRKGVMLTLVVEADK